MTWRLHRQRISAPLRTLRRKAWSSRRLWMTALAVTGCVMGARSLGVLQNSELWALDQLFQARPAEAKDTRITVVSIDDQDIQAIRDWPLPDLVMANLLEQLRSYQPRAIGLDIYREIPVGRGTAKLQQVFKTTPNLIGIEKLEDDKSVGVLPPPILQQQGQIGFNNVVVDADNHVRRAILFWKVGDTLHRSFALQLALTYLKAEGVEMQPAPGNPAHIQLGQSVFPRLQPHDGGYVRADMGGYQILTNPRSPQVPFDRVSVRQVLNGEVQPELLRDRIVLIGSTAPSLKDFFYTSHSRVVDGSPLLVSGVELHANFVSQILSAALNGRSPIQIMPGWGEWLWILSWAVVGAALSWRLRHPFQTALALLLSEGGLVGLCYLAFLGGWWIPLLPPAIALGSSVVVIISYIAFQEEELKKSKEFLNSVINAIPDPIFVKDQDHRWIVLNQAYCRFVGHPLHGLLEKTDCDVFSPEQAARLWEQDNKAFALGSEYESEEELTNTAGVTYQVATKRSLHRDAAGNVFLVGVIRDITQRKRVEDELRRTAAELVRSNAELKQAEHRLRHMAYHDSLTSLPNRELFEDRLSQCLNLAVGHQQFVAVLFLDLDGFKAINDTYGHAMGDLLLKAVAQRLLHCLRSSDTVARFGGDEFVVLLPAIPQLQDVVTVAEKITDTLSQPFALNGYTIPVTTSIGVSVYPSDAENAEALIRNADMAMYQAKGLGKNRYMLHQPAQHPLP